MDYTKKIEACNTLDELFSLWKEKQSNEPKESCYGEGNKTGTFPREDGKSPDYDTFKDGFYPDGVTSRVGNESSTNRCQVLFILNEPNVTEKITKGKDKYKDSFWFNKAVGESDREKYAQRFELAIQRLIETQGLKQEDSKLYGFMNLNKRGGYGETGDQAPLAAYVKKYLPFIEKQISLLSPKYIVCCGNYELLRKELFKTTDKHNASVSIYPQQYKITDNHFAKVYYIYHPCNCEKRFIRGLDYIGQLK